GGQLIELINHRMVRRSSNRGVPIIAVQITGQLAGDLTGVTIAVQAAVATVDAIVGELAVHSGIFWTNRNEFVVEYAGRNIRHFSGPGRRYIPVAHADILTTGDRVVNQLDARVDYPEAAGR